MTKALGVALTVVFVSASVLGTIWNGWFLGQVLAPADTSPLATFVSPSLCLAMLAAIAECLRLALALQAEGIWRKSRFQGAVFAGPLWLVCTTYCTLMPLLTLVIIPLPPITDSPLLAFLAAAWAFIQIAAGLLPGIAWPSASPTISAEAVRSQSFAAIRREVISLRAAVSLPTMRLSLRKRYWRLLSADPNRPCAAGCNNWSAASTSRKAQQGKRRAFASGNIGQHRMATPGIIGSTAGSGRVNSRPVQLLERRSADFH